MTGATGVVTKGYQAPLGSVGNNLALQVATPGLAGSGAYSSGQVVGGLLTFSAAARGPGMGGLIQSVIMLDQDGQNAVTDVIFFAANPSNSTFTDQAAVALAAADLAAARVGVAHITDWTLAAAATMGIGTDPTFRGIPFQCASGLNTLYAVMVTRGTPTYTGASKVSLAIHLLQD